ncbi:MAG TPA: DUF2393 family protein [Terriglobales bacterium]|nr:DUF2393 family protein [Terriglobales bacterium]
MATNPQYPDPRRPSQRFQGRDNVRDIRTDSPGSPRREFPWPVLAIVAAAAILAALIYWLPRTPHRLPPPSAAQVPQQPTGNQIQLTNLAVEHAPVGNSLYLTGNIHNNGSTDITGVQLQATFLGNNGQVLDTQTRPVEGLANPNDPTPQDLTKAPIKPNQSRMFRIYFEHYPAGWNKEVPGLKITTVTGTTP